MSVRGVTREALRRLEQYPWRGNVRELEVVLEQAMIFRRGDWIPRRISTCVCGEPTT